MNFDVVSTRIDDRESIGMRDGVRKREREREREKYESRLGFESDRLIVNEIV